MSQPVVRPAFFPLQVFTLCGLFFAAGCGGMKGPEPISVDGLNPVEPVAAAQSLREIYHQANEIKSFRGSYQGIVDSPAGRVQFRLVVAFVRPEKLRLEVLFTGLNRLSTLLTVADGQARLLDANNRRLYSGPVNAESIARLTGVPLSAAELMLWFSGRYRPESAGQIGNYRVFNGPQPIAVFSLTGQRHVVIRECAGRAGVLDAHELRTGEDQDEVLITRYDCNDRPGSENAAAPAAAAENAAGFPKTIQFWLPQDRAEGTLTLESGKLNTDLSRAPTALFQPADPGGVEDLPLSAASKGALFGGGQ